MIFPIQYCVQCSLLKGEDYNSFIAKLTVNGYNWPSMYDKGGSYQTDSYIGVNVYGDIQVFQKPEDFISPHELEFNNTLTKDWISRYLKRG